MKYLLDVNALIALGFLEHEFHQRVSAWLETLKDGDVATCPITELGFVRVLSAAPAYSFTVAQSSRVLKQLKQARHFVFVADDRDISRLPRWVKTARQTTDGHLAELAEAHGGRLATLDQKIPGAYVIP